MKVSENGRKFITSHEGEILKVYKDPVGLWTMGCGHLLTPAEKKIYSLGQKITKEQSQAFLAADLERFERAVEKAVKVPLNQNEFDALVSLAFNIGEAAFRRSSVLRHLNSGDRHRAADSFLLWNKAGGKVLPGLVRRRKEERELFLTRTFTDSAASTPALAEQDATPTDSTPTLPDTQPAEQPTILEAEPHTETTRKERPSLFARIITALGVITGTLTTMGIGFGPVLTQKLGELSPSTFFYGMLGVVIVGICIAYYDRAAKRADGLNRAKIATLADRGSNSVEFR